MSGTYSHLCWHTLPLLSLTGKCKIRQNIFVVLQQCNVGSKNFSSRKSKSLEFHSNFLEGGSQTNPSTGRMPARQVKILWKCKMCHNCHTRPSAADQTILHSESVAPHFCHCLQGFLPRAL